MGPEEIARLRRATGSDVQGCGPVMAEPGPEPKVMLGNKGYDADVILDDLEGRGVTAVIPPKRNRKVQRIIDGHLYALRNLVERCFSKLKHSRRLATRYDRSPTATSASSSSPRPGYGSGTSSTEPRELARLNPINGGEGHTSAPGKVVG